MLSELQARRELVAPLTGDEHVMSGGFARGVLKNPGPAPSDQRSEFSVREKEFVAFLTWHPQQRVRGVTSLQIHDATTGW